MAEYEFGLIGTGHMGSALLKSVAQAVDPKKIILSNRSPEKAMALAERYGCAVGDNAQAAKARYIMLGVKPQMMRGVMAGIAPVLAGRSDRFALITMAAGLTMAQIAEMAGGSVPVIRIMPNTPAEIGEGLVMMARNDLVTDDELAGCKQALSRAGRIDEVDEGLIDAGSAVAGCGPAYAYLFIEALADGGVACGLPRAKAMEYAAQMLKGAAALALETGRHPGALKDDVCSPAGSTIQGVRALEQNGFRSACMEAVIAAFEKNRALGKN